MRLIDADAALEIFQELTELAVGEGAALVKALIFAGLKSRTITPTVGGWISVKDRLPDKSGTYLMHAENGEVFSAEYDSCADDDCCFGWWQEYFDGETLGCVGGEFAPVHGITHWMPLPEPTEEVTA